MPRQETHVSFRLGSLAQRPKVADTRSVSRRSHNDRRWRTHVCLASLAQRPEPSRSLSEGAQRPRRNAYSAGRRDAPAGDTRFVSSRFARTTTEGGGHTFRLASLAQRPEPSRSLREGAQRPRRRLSGTPRRRDGIRRRLLRRRWVLVPGGVQLCAVVCTVRCAARYGGRVLTARRDGVCATVGWGPTRRVRGSAGPLRSCGSPTPSGRGSGGATSTGAHRCRCGWVRRGRVR
ncbi:hypothetical protein RS84_00657 [Microbacterium hydrocarbonoxydans]|uniref:Uncharacterized protein n=1 Tax=Microbacterium hydrocarbonoxydans TaxID=273678 RepID=A0A0M2HQI8_9MICO|nr:hypothetical protein RS84_00657 [Microbacterium hydrocarbonoxydans]